MDRAEKHDNCIDIPVSGLKLAGGFNALAAIRDWDGNSLSGDDWQNALADMDSLLQACPAVLKDDTYSRVYVKDFNIAGRSLEVVVKIRKPKNKQTARFNFLGRYNSVHCFNTALKLISQNIATAYPLAAIYPKPGMVELPEILINQHISNSVNLHDFICDGFGGIPEYKAKQQLTAGLTDILAGLHRANLKHRDAKVANFVVRKRQHNEIKIYIIDLEGIKPCGLLKNRNYTTALEKLAVTLLRYGRLNNADFMRALKMFNKKAGVENIDQKQQFKKLEKTVHAEWIVRLDRHGFKYAKDSH
jgi:tRNA A-37 threonylcarbamoyl transferase component Bud32